MIPKVNRWIALCNICILSLWGCLVFMPSVYANGQWQTLYNITQAGQLQAFEGTYMHHIQGGILETFYVIRSTGHRVQTWEKRTSLDGLPREIIRNGETIICYAQDQAGLDIAKMNTTQLFPAILSNDMIGIEQSYQLQSAGTDRVAQRTCNVFELRPKDPGRYTLRLCADTASFLPLKTTVFSPKGNIVETFAFTNISLDQPFKKHTYVSKMKQKFQMPTNKPNRTLNHQDKEGISGLPIGFKLVRAIQRNLPGQPNTSVRHLVLSDGLVVLSLFIEPLAPHAYRLEHSNHLNGATNIATRTAGDYRLTVVGNMPEESLPVLLKNIKIRNKP